MVESTGRVVRRSAPLAVVALVFALLSGAPASSSVSGRTMLVFGDSISSWYSDEKGSPSRAWWSFVGERLNMNVRVSAEPGSGYWDRGNLCGGTTFGDRLGQVARVRPDVVVVAGGRNDYRGCTGHGSQQRGIKRSSSEKAVKSYLGKLAAAVDRAGVPRSNVYVFTPWGTVIREKHYYIWRAQRKYAKAYGFKYVEVRFLDRKYTLDGTHPNEAGSRRLADGLLSKSDLVRRFGG